jgi:tetrahydromethanopterin S-methyltransferase subunit G
MTGEETNDRLSRIEERLERMERLLAKTLESGRREPDSIEPLDVEQAQQRLDDLGQRIDETKRTALGKEEPTEAVAETEDPVPEGDVEQANEVVGEGPPAPG